VPFEAVFSFFLDLLFERGIFLACHLVPDFLLSVLVVKPTPRYAPLPPTAVAVRVFSLKKNFFFFLQMLQLSASSSAIICLLDGVFRNVCLPGGNKFSYQFL
jgi:hypothetical protein